MRRLVPLLLAGLLVLAACGGKDDNKVSSSDKKSTTTSISDESTTTAVGDVAAGASTTVAGKTATTRKGAASSSGGGGGAAAQPSTPSGVKAAAPGTYTLKTTGTMTLGTPQPVNATSTMKIEPLQGSDQKSTQTGDNGASGETVLRYQSDGVYLVSLKTSQQGITKEFRPNPPGLSFPQPATIGKTYSWAATSTDGKTNVKSDFKVVRTEAQQVGSESVQTVVIEATVTLSGDINATSHRTMWVSELYRLIVRSDDKTQGSYSGFQFSSDTSEKLQSTKPA